MSTQQTIVIVELLAPNLMYGVVLEAKPSSYHKRGVV